jgi:hypothetical protein
MAAGDAAVITHVVVDHVRLGDLGKFDTPAEDFDHARILAEALCRQTGQPCHVLAVVATVQPGLTLTWSMS